MEMREAFDKLEEQVNSIGSQSSLSWQELRLLVLEMRRTEAIEKISTSLTTIVQLMHLEASK